MGMSGDASKSQDNAGVLDRIIRIIEHSPHRTDVRPLGKHQHLLQPIRRDHLNVVVQQQYVLPCRSFPDPEVIDGRIIELPFPGDDLNTRVGFQLVVIRERLFFPAVVLDNDDLEILVGGLLQNGGDARSQRIGMIHVGDHNGHLGTAGNGVLDPIGGRDRRVLHFTDQANSVQMLAQRSPRGVHRIRLRRYITGC